MLNRATGMVGEQVRLREITRQIVDRERPLGSLIAETGALGSLLEKHAEFRMEPGRDIASGETLTGAGLAISPTQAAMCLREPVRTAAFIRGAARAIQESAASAKRTLRVLYAGCGPYAPLAVPLMSLFPTRKVRFTLLDIHRQSLDSAMTVVNALGFSDHVSAYVHDNACSYTIPAQEKPDIIISETMNAALTKEPLVTIACRLLSQAPNAVMLPRRVWVDACLMDLAKEFLFLDPDHEGEHPEPKRDRVFLGRVFELNPGKAKTWAGLSVDRLPAELIEIPSPLEDRYVPRLLTTVQVYADVVLEDYNSSITCPQPLARGERLLGGERLQFHYRLGSKPRLVHEIVAPGGQCQHHWDQP